LAQPNTAINISDKVHNGEVEDAILFPTAGQQDEDGGGQMQDTDQCGIQTEVDL
jgi:hypothetical protein